MLVLLARVPLGVDPDPPLAPPKSTSTIAHVWERPGPSLRLVHRGGEADPALDGEPVMVVLGPPARDHLAAAPRADRELEGVDAVAGLDLIGRPRGSSVSIAARSK